MSIIKKSKVNKIDKAQMTSPHGKQYTVGVVGLRDTDSRGLGWATAKLLAIKNKGVGKVGS